jgi:PAS domain-containing protein
VNLVEAASAEPPKVLRKKKLFRGNRNSRKWGKKSYLMYSAVPVTGSDGQVHQVICTVKDISRIKRAEDKGRQQIDFLNIVINTMQEPFFVKDENHRWIMLNDAAVKMMGEPRNPLWGNPTTQLIRRSSGM